MEDRPDFAKLSYNTGVFRDDKDIITYATIRESAQDVRAVIIDAEDHLNNIGDAIENDDGPEVAAIDSLRECLSIVYDIVHSICDTNANDTYFLREANACELMLITRHEELIHNPVDLSGFTDMMNKIRKAIDAFSQLKKGLSLLVTAKLLDFVTTNKDKRLYTMTDEETNKEFYLAQGEHLDIVVLDRELRKVKVRKTVDNKPVAFRATFASPTPANGIDYVVCDFERFRGLVTLMYAELRCENRTPIALKITKCPPELLKCDTLAGGVI